MEVLTPIKVVRAPRRHTGKIATGSPDRAYRAYELLYFGMIITLGLAGLDKFFGFTADWEGYVAPWLANLFGGTGPVVTLTGLVQLGIAVLVAFSPRIGGLAAAGYFAAAIVNLVTYPGFGDTALRCFGLMMACWALSKLAGEYGQASEVTQERQEIESLLRT